jgi:MerR family transcriptional regulator/heat shock protein HspR
MATYRGNVEPDMDENTPVYSIGVVSRMLKVHPQTLRFYEREGLFVPGRTQKNTRLYSQRDVERLRLILTLTQQLGVNIAGTEIILALRDRIDRMRQELLKFLAAVKERSTAEVPDLEILRDDAAIVVSGRPPLALRKKPRRGARNQPRGSRE